WNVSSIGKVIATAACSLDGFIAAAGPPRPPAPRAATASHPAGHPVPLTANRIMDATITPVYSASQLLVTGERGRVRILPPARCRHHAGLVPAAPAAPARSRQGLRDDPSQACAGPRAPEAGWMSGTARRLRPLYS